METKTPKTRIELIAEQVTKMLRDREKTSLHPLTMDQTIELMGALKKGLTITKMVDRTQKHTNKSVSEVGFIELKEFDGTAQIPCDVEEMVFGADFTGKVKHIETPEEIAEKERVAAELLANEAAATAAALAETTNVVADNPDEMQIQVNQADLDANPELAEKGVKVGDTITISKKDIDAAKKQMFASAKKVEGAASPADEATADKKEGDGSETRLDVKIETILTPEAQAEETIKAFETAMEAGQKCFEAKDYPAAKAYFEKAQELDPKSEAAALGLENVSVALEAPPADKTTSDDGKGGKGGKDAAKNTQQEKKKK